MKSTRNMASAHLAPRRLVPLVVVLALASFAQAQAGSVFRAAQTLHVLATGTDQDRCQALRDALSTITDSGAGKAYTVKLPAGSYDCQSTTVLVPEYVILEGAGRDRTVISGVVDHAILGVLHLPHRATALRLTVANDQANPVNGGIAISAWDLEPPDAEARLVDVRATGAQSPPNNHSLLAIGGTVIVSRSWMDDTVALDTGATASISYSALDDVQTTGGATALCRFFIGIGSTPSALGGCP